MLALSRVPVWWQLEHADSVALAAGANSAVSLACRASVRPYLSAWWQVCLKTLSLKEASHCS